MLKDALWTTLAHIEQGFATISPGVIGESPALINVLFHSIYRRRSDIEAGTFHPQQRVTVDDFRAFLDAFLEAGYTVVAPDALHSEEAPSRRSLMVTFDDGYFNNSLAGEILSAYQVPATFFISTSHVLEQKSFWWDAVYRSVRESRRVDEFQTFKRWKTEDVEAHLIKLIGKDVLRPRGDLDRPFTASELKDFARNRFVHLGNHTRNHAILTNYPPQEALAQIRDCQQDIHAIAGYLPTIIAYPNGNVSSEVLELSRREGLKAGVTLRPRKNALPLTPDSIMALGRFILWGDRSVVRQCDVFRSDFMPTRYLTRLGRGYGAS